jgi:hypothetical protein
MIFLVTLAIFRLLPAALPVGGCKAAFQIYYASFQFRFVLLYFALLFDSRLTGWRNPEDRNWQLLFFTGKSGTRLKD